MTKISARSTRPSSRTAPIPPLKEIIRPFGDQAGNARSWQPLVLRRQFGPIRCASVPSPPIVQISHVAAQRSKTIRDPSGDQSGFEASDRLTHGSFVAPVPSAFTTQRVGKRA